MASDGKPAIPGLFTNSSPQTGRSSMGGGMGGGGALGGRDIVAELNAEKDTLDPSYVHSIRLLTEGEVVAGGVRQAGGWGLTLVLSSFKMSPRHLSPFLSLCLSPLLPSPPPPSVFFTHTEIQRVRNGGCEGKDPNTRQNHKIYVPMDAQKKVLIDQGQV